MKAPRFYDDWLTAGIPDDEPEETEDDDHSDEQFDKLDRERDFT